MEPGNGQVPHLLVHIYLLRTAVIGAILLYGPPLARG